MKKYILLVLGLPFFFISNLFAAQEVTWTQFQLLETKAGSVEVGKPPEELTKLIAGEVSVKGFMMPMDYTQKKISEFLLMPYIPACMHVPPPPANQLILVRMAKGKEVDPSFYPVEITGKVIIKPSLEFESSYEMTGESMKEITE